MIGPHATLSTWRRTAVLLLAVALVASPAAAGDRYWAAVDYLLWEVAGYETQPLATSSPFGTPRVAAGVLPNASILYGGERLDLAENHGGRFRLGAWIGEGETTGLELSFFSLGADATSFYAESDGSTASLGRPFFNDDINGQDALLVAFDQPGPASLYSGSIQIETSSDIDSAGLTLRSEAGSIRAERWEVTCGYRFFRLGERLAIHDALLVDGVSGGVVGTTYELTDRFDTTNEFHGAEIGMVRTVRRGRWSSELMVKLALGNNRREVEIHGEITTTIPGFPAVTGDGGLLAQPTNIGGYASNQLSVLPELNLNLHRRVTERLSLTAGFTAVCMSDVVRPGGAISPNVNASQLSGPLSGPATPVFSWNTDVLWLYGVNLGATYAY